MTCTVGERVRHLRTLSGLSGRELSRLAGLHPSHVGLIEHEQLERLDANTVQALARVLGSSMDWLYSGVGRIPSKRAIEKAVEGARLKATG